MSQVAKSASAFVRAFLAILVLALEDKVVRLVRPPKLVNLHGDRWTVRMPGFGTFRTSGDVRFKSAIRAKAGVRQAL